MFPVNFTPQFFLPAFRPSFLSVISTLSSITAGGSRLISVVEPPQWDKIHGYILACRSGGVDQFNRLINLTAPVFHSGSLEMADIKGEPRLPL